MFFEGKYGVEGNVLVVPAKRRRSPRSATPNAAVLYPGMTPTSHFQLRHRFIRTGLPLNRPSRERAVRVSPNYACSNVSCFSSVIQV